MDDLSVTLIVKAPNQQIDDQTIKCDLSWTIKKLKTHIQEVYPSKPRIEEQKLIYSGQLLGDSLVLKNVLRYYEGQENHTVHLVCAPSKNCYRNTKSSVKKTEPPTVNTQPTSSTSPSPNSSINGLMAGTSQQAASNSGISRNCQQSASITTPGMNTANADYTVPTSSQNGGPRIEDIQESLKNQFLHISQPSYDLDSQLYAAQIAMFQHNYINYYNQYMQMYSNQLQNLSQRRSISTLPDIPVGNTPVEDNRVPQVDPAANGRVPDPVPNINVNPGEPDDAGIDRDWLDWFYVLSRLTVLFSVVYFYSSPMRFILVFVLGFAMYLYQVGFFRGHLENNNVNNNVDHLAAENNNNRRNNNVEQPENVADNDRPQQPPAPPIEVPDRPTVLGVMWTFFTTFFASLIPEIPNAI